MCLNTFNTQFYIEYITSEFQNTKINFFIARIDIKYVNTLTHKQRSVTLSSTKY
jgi:hypothetical protein